jgi:hypothetical protein
LSDSWLQFLIVAVLNLFSVVCRVVVHIWRLVVPRIVAVAASAFTWRNTGHPLEQVVLIVLSLGILSQVISLFVNGLESCELVTKFFCCRICIICINTSIAWIMSGDSALGIEHVVAVIS